MPSPVGHFLAGVAVSWSVLPPPEVPRSLARLRHAGWKPFGNTLLFGCAAVAPDVDILFDSHRTATHSLTAVVLVFLAILAVKGRGHALFAAGLAGAVGSHVLLDWLSEDPTSFTGVMLFWPVSREYFPPPVAVFLSIWKDVSRPEAYAHNGIAVLRELLILLPVVGVLRWLRRPER